MTKVLIIDDNPDKIREIKNCINTSKGNKKIDIDVASNIKIATKKVSETEYDLVILDMLIPLSAHKEPTKSGGLRFIDNIETQTNLHKPKRVIGLTAFEDNYETCRKRFHDNAWLLEHYNQSSTDWHKPIIKIIGELTANEGNSKHITKTANISLETLLVVSIFILMIVVIFCPISYGPIQETVLFLVSSILVALMFGKYSKSKFKMKIGVFTATTTGSAALIFIAMLLLTNISTPKTSIGVYTLVDKLSNPLIFDAKLIKIAPDSRMQVPTYYVNDNTLIVVFPNANEVYKITYKEQTKQIRYTKGKVLNLSF